MSSNYALYAAKMAETRHPTVLFVCADHRTPYLDTVFDPAWAANAAAGAACAIFVGAALLARRLYA